VRATRTRLTLTYAGLLLATLLLLNVGVYLAMTRALSQEAFASAQLLAEQATRLVMQSGEGEGRGVAFDQADPSLAETLGRGDLFLEVRNGDGSVASRSRALDGNSIVASRPLENGPAQYRKILPGVGLVAVYLIELRRDGKIRALIAAARSLTEVNRTLRNLGALLAAASASAFLIAVGSGWWVAGMALRPIETSLARERRFTADVAHELKTPLTILQGEIDVAMRRPRTEVEYRARLGSLRVAVGRLASLVGDLLTLARAESEGEALQKDHVEVKSLVEAVVERFRKTAGQRSIVLRTGGTPQAATTGDAARLDRALSNLVDNAIRHSDAEGTVTVEWRTTPSGLIISVTNAGEGIAPEQLEHIFDRFYRVDTHRSRTEGGAGLGLAIAKSIVEAHGGIISAHSVPGSTVFEIHL